jgi:NAD(P) transhydrogenase subunit alpha
MIRDGKVLPDWDDQVFAESVLTHQGEIRHAPTRTQVEGESS